MLFRSVVGDCLFNKARLCNVSGPGDLERGLDEHFAAVDESATMYSTLYAWHVKRGDYRTAAAAMYVWLYCC